MGRGSIAIQKMGEDLNLMKAQTDQEIDQAIVSFTDLQKVIVLKALLKQCKGNASDLDALMKDFEKLR